MFMMRSFISLLAVITLLSACAHPPGTGDMPAARAMPPAGVPAENSSWWYIQFVKHWPANTPPRFDYDILLADQVFRPVLIRHHDDISLWRFHRRAARDPAGSKFAFIFYSSADAARAIAEDVRDHELVKEMMAAGLIEKIWIDNFDMPKRPAIEDTSDKEWPVSIQKSWPYYIMGVSQGWLALIKEVTVDHPIDTTTSTLDEITEHYKEISQIMDFLWTTGGGHAYIHHLSALFGYEPVQIRF